MTKPLIKVRAVHTASAMGKLGAPSKKIKKLEHQVEFLEEDAPATTPLTIREIGSINAELSCD